MRAQFGVNVIAVRNDQGINVSPGGDYVLSANDVVVALGRAEDTNLLHDL